MKQLKNILPGQGANQWNNFIHKQEASVPPFSFNPSLLNFYSAYFHWLPYYFLVYDKDQLVGVFPLVDTGRKFVSLPHFSYGGLLLTDAIKVNVLQLSEILIRLVKEEKPKPGFLVFQLNKQKYSTVNKSLQNEKLFIRSESDFTGASKSNKVSSYLKLSESKTEMLKQLTSNLRRKIRKTMTNGLEAKHGGVELLDDFYGVYARNIHRLGSPMYAKSFFRAIFDKYENGHTKIFLSLVNGRTVGAAFLMSYFGFFENTWFATSHKHKNYFVSDHLHWQMIQYAIEKKGVVYSLGRSTASGSVHHYKNHWPVSDKALFQFDTEQGIQLKNQQWLTHLWKIAPFPFTLRLGPMLVKHIY